MCKLDDRIAELEDELDELMREPICDSHKVERGDELRAEINTLEEQLRVRNMSDGVWLNWVLTGKK